MEAGPEVWGNQEGPPLRVAMVNSLLTASANAQSLTTQRDDEVEDEDDAEVSWQRDGAEPEGLGTKLADLVKSEPDISDSLLGC